MPAWEANNPFRNGEGFIKMFYLVASKPGSSPKIVFGNMRLLLTKGAQRVCGRMVVQK